MSEDRLSLKDPNLSDRLTLVSEQTLRSIALLVCRFAIQHTGLEDPVLSEGCAALEAAQYNDEALRDRVEMLVAELDIFQWNMQESFDQGKTDKKTWMLAFQRARAANSLYFALDDNALIAARESIYEAIAATENSTMLRKLVLESMSTR